MLDIDYDYCPFCNTLLSINIKFLIAVDNYQSLKECENEICSNYSSLREIGTNKLIDFYISIDCEDVFYSVPNEEITVHIYSPTHLIIKIPITNVVFKDMNDYISYIKMIVAYN